MAEGYGSLWLVRKRPHYLSTFTSPPPPPPPPAPPPPPLNHASAMNQTPPSQTHISLNPNSKWDFTLSTVVSSSASSNTLGVIEFDPSETLLATAGIARKIRIYNVSSILRNTTRNYVDDVVHQLDHASACDYFITTPAKLSCLRWRPASASRVIASADYDGVVTEYDLESRLPVFERDEHSGRRVWSLDYSPDTCSPLATSASDDGSVHIWDPRAPSGECVARAVPSNSLSPVCCVEFNPFDGVPILAVGCADRNAYVYDVRMMAGGPVLRFDGHDKTVTYVRFIESRRIVSSGIDGCIKMWSAEDAREIRNYSGHENRRSFVGLSVWRSGGLIGCGSEDNRVYVYDVGLGEPIWVHGFGPMGSEGFDERGFVSSVCWRQRGGDDDTCTLVAGGSDGVLQVFEGRRRDSF